MGLDGKLWCALCQCAEKDKGKFLDHVWWLIHIAHSAEHIHQASKMTPRSNATRAPLCHQLHATHDHCTVTVRHLDLGLQQGPEYGAAQRGIHSLSMVAIQCALKGREQRGPAAVGHLILQ